MNIYLYKCKLVRVIDGDTIVLDIDLGFDTILKNQHIRLIGVDTPETRTKDLTEKYYGNLSKEYVISLLDDKKLLLNSIEYNRTGKYGRILGDIIIKDNDKTLCELILENHYGIKYTDDKVTRKKLHLENRKYFDTKSNTN